MLDISKTENSVRNLIKNDLPLINNIANVETQNTNTDTNISENISNPDDFANEDPSASSETESSDSNEKQNPLIQCFS